jgi:hypothetical protein
VVAAEGDATKTRVARKRLARGRPVTTPEDVLLQAEEPLRAQAEALAETLLSRREVAMLAAPENPLATGADGLRAVEPAEEAMCVRDRAELGPQKLGPGLAPLLRTRYVALRR